MKCGRCQQSCSQQGHLRPSTVTRNVDDSFLYYDCLRCGVRLRQNLCECCEEEVGTPEPMESAPAAAKRLAQG